MSKRRPLPVPLAEIPFVIPLEERSPPFSWEELFARGGPVELEVGSGKGLFLLEASGLRPECNFLGIERAQKYFLHAVGRLLRAERANVRLVRADAFDLLSRWIPSGSLSALHVYFPDPWPKKRHAKRRLLQAPLYQLGAAALMPGGSFYLASDVALYFEQAVADIQASGLFEPAPWPEAALDRPSTNYAHKYALEGRSLHFARFRRRASLPPCPTPVAC